MFFKKKSVRLSGLALVAVLAMNLLGNISGVPGGARAQDTQTFVDVPASHWAYEPIQRATDNGWVKGVGNDRFDPDGTVSNAQWIVMVTRAFYSSEVERIAILGNSERWWSPYCSAAAVNGVLEATTIGDSYFAEYKWDEDLLNTPISRYDMAQVALNFMSGNDFTVSEAQKKAAQAKIGDWAEIPVEYRDGVSACYALGVISGTSAGTFEGNRSMSRAEAVTVLARLADATGKGTTPAPEPTPEPTPKPTPTPVPSESTLSNGKPVTEENVLELIAELKVQYPTESSYDAQTRYYIKQLDAYGIECTKLAWMFSDSIFGDLPATTHTDISRIRPGDIVEMNGGSHWSFSAGYPTFDTSDNTFSLPTADGGPAGIIDWNTRYRSVGSTDWVIYTRYPQ